MATQCWRSRWTGSRVLSETRGIELDNLEQQLPMWSVILSAVLSASAVTAVLKIFPKFIFDAAIKLIEHRNNIKIEEIKSDLARTSSIEIERLKSEFDATYSTLRSSVDFLSSSQKEYRIKMISATEHLWKLCLDVKSEFSDLIYACDLLTSDEFKDEIERETRKPFMKKIEIYQNQNLVSEKFIKCESQESEVERLFVSPKLWLIFFTLRSLHGRIAYKIGESLKERKYYNWRVDPFLLSQLKYVVPSEHIDKACKAKIQGIQMIILQLEFEFLLESGKIMSGSQPLSERLSDMQKILLAESQKIKEMSKPT
jgi:hypothetical protein